MKNAYEVLYRKEADVARVRKEIESLKTIAPLLTDESMTFFTPSTEPSSETRKAVEKVASQDADLRATGTDAKPTPAKRPGFWAFKRRHQN